MDKYEKIKELIDNASNIVILSGAGVSVPSGIPDFRSRNGLYEKHDNIETVLNRSTFNNSKEKFWTDYKNIFYKKLLTINTEPNAAHELAVFMKSLNKNVKVITQNVDGLYQKAGVLKEDILEIHGNVRTLTCTICGRKHDTQEKLKDNTIPICNTNTYGHEYCLGYLDVDVVLFGDLVKEMPYANELVTNADLVFVMGTSLQVQPFASLLTNNKKRKNVLLNFTNISNRPFEVKLLQDVAKSSQQIIDLYKK